VSRYEGREGMRNFGRMGEERDKVDKSRRKIRVDRGK
jgi:hypothetical protein